MLTAIPVLLYHRIGVDDDPFTVDPDAFAQHLELIAHSGMTSLTVTELAQALRGEVPLPEAVMGFTVDDGYADTRESIELAASLGIKSTLYVTTGAVNKPGGVTTDDLVQLASAGSLVELGCHSVTHPYLDELPSHEAAVEISSSRETLADWIGQPVRSFAYPHGAHSAKVRKLVVDAGFESCAAVKNALSHQEDDPWAIARVTITKSTSVAQLEALLQGRGAPLAWRHERLRTRAYRAKRTVARRLREGQGVGTVIAPARRALAGTPTIGTAGARAPVAVAQLDLATPETSVHLPTSRDGRPYTAVALLVRDNGEPAVWTLIPPPAGGELSVAQLAPRFQQRILQLRDAPPSSPPPTVSVVINTCADAASTLTCVQSVLAADHLPSEVIVVDNRPDGSPVAAAVAQLSHTSTMPIRYVTEHRRGLAAARNAGLAAAGSDFVTFTDDDVTVDRAWLSAITAAIQRDPAIDCVSGLILPLELENEAQVAFEHFTSLYKGLIPRRFSLSDPPSDFPMFPYAAGYFGSGANTTFRRATLEALGGFDPLLGAGTPTKGGEDLDIFIRLLSAGFAMAYEPAALVWHRHPETEVGLDQRVLSYGVGFGAVAAKLILSRRHRRAIVRLAPTAVRYWFDPRSRKNAPRTTGLISTGARMRETIGVALGALIYVRSWLSTASRR